jgi:putative membrane protein
LITEPRRRLSGAWGPLLLSSAVLVVWDVLVTVLYFQRPEWFKATNFPFTLFGSAIALFVGFAVNAAYNRWWEARTLWGQVVNSSRSLARQAVVLIDDPAVSTEVVHAQIAYVHALRTSLRGQPLPEEALLRLRPEAAVAVGRASNKPSAVLLAADRGVSRARAAGDVGEISRTQLEESFVALSNAQGGLERIRNTPLPVHYRVLPTLFARVFCLVLPFAVVEDLGWATPVGSGLVGVMFLLAIKVGQDLAEPFRDGVHDIPMTTLCRTIEIDLTQVLGERSPDQLGAVDDVLW